MCLEDHGRVQEQIFHDEEHRQDQVEHILHEQHGQDQVIIGEIQEFESCEQVHEHIQESDNESRTGSGVLFHGKGNENKPGDSDSHGEEMNEVKKNDNLTKQSKDEMIRRVQEELSSLDLQMERVRHHEKLCATSGDNTLGRLIGMKRSLVRVQKGYHADSSKLLLYRRLKIRRQKRLNWNMILLRERMPQQTKHWCPS